MPLPELSVKKVQQNEQGRKSNSKARQVEGFYDLVTYGMQCLVQKKFRGVSDQNGAGKNDVAEEEFAFLIEIMLE